MRKLQGQKFGRLFVVSRVPRKPDEHNAILMAKQNRRITHGMTGTPEYQAWTKMKLRCYDQNNPKYYAYGSRGIKVCDRWRRSFENFYADLGPRPSPIHSLDRIDNDKNYEPSNCRWALPLIQMRNGTRNNVIEIAGTKHCVTEWCDRLGIPRWKPYEMTRSTGTWEAYLFLLYRTIKEALTTIYLAKHK